MFFGDPSTEFRSKLTTQITANHPSTYLNNGESFLVTSNTEGATVTISQNNEILVKSEIIGGSASLVIPALSSTNSLKVTLTKDNTKPYRGNTNVAALGSETFESDFAIYPNPTSDYINIEYLNRYITDVSVQLIDINGRIIYTKNNLDLSSKFSLPVIGIASGLYFLEIKDDFNRKVQKIQIK